jgi:hypothetical protein
MFWRSILHQSLEVKIKADCSFETLRAKDGGNMFLRNLDIYLQFHTTSQTQKTNTDRILTDYSYIPGIIATMQFRIFSHPLWLAYLNKRD